jgi:hypothetical protein
VGDIATSSDNDLVLILNQMIFQAFLAYGIPGSELKFFSLMRKVHLLTQSQVDFSTSLVTVRDYFASNPLSSFSHFLFVT